MVSQPFSPQLTVPGIVVGGTGVGESVGVGENANVGVGVDDITGVTVGVVAGTVGVGDFVGEMVIVGVFDTGGAGVAVADPALQSQTPPPPNKST